MASHIDVMVGPLTEALCTVQMWCSKRIPLNFHYSSELSFPCIVPGLDAVAFERPGTSHGVISILSAILQW